ncbi:MAG: patatin-like phospholipase family protein [Cryomorphaceae bacterium]|nr:patatin-like phospholipase family protein [Cryomorphaceae bacterium]
MNEPTEKKPRFIRVHQLWIFFATFFPVRLFVLHLRRSILMLLLWLFLFFAISETLFTDYGVHLLFLIPEYRGETNFMSFFLTGLGLGLFTMAFHVSSYIFYSYRYSFLATLDRPIYRFSINNSLIPGVFILYFCRKLYLFHGQLDYTILDRLILISGLLFGVFFMIAFVFTYFFTLNRSKNVFEDKPIKSVNKFLQNLYSKRNDIDILTTTDLRVHTYLKNFHRLRATRTADHYEFSKLINALEQHHLRAAYFFLALIILLVGLGTFEEYDWVQIPAVSTLLILLSVLIMISGAFFSRFKGWTTTAAIATIIIINYLSALPPFYKPNQATGLDYDTTPAEFSRDILYRNTTDSIVQNDREHWIQILENWKARQKSSKPKLVIYNVSGGGIRSSIWTYTILDKLDSIYGGALHHNAFLITGSSGGMLGASYFREIKYRKQTADWPENAPKDKDVLARELSADMLNPTVFNFLVNDLFFRFRKHEYGNRLYYKDRGVALDQAFNRNTFGMLDKTLGDYSAPEFTANMPIMIFAPIMIQDGRRMVISAQPTSFLTFTRNQQSILEEKVFDGLEFSRIFENQDAMNLSFLTANRISASFPYITPLVNLPSKPDIALIDAGVRDNDGFEIGMRMVHELNDWIKENTSGVVFIRIKADKSEDEPLLTNELSRDRLAHLLRPVGGLFASFAHLQVFNKSLIRQFGEAAIDVPIEVINFPLFRPGEEENLSLSWRLTEIEQEQLRGALLRPENRHAIERVQKIINTRSEVK